MGTLRLLSAYWRICWLLRLARSWVQSRHSLGAGLNNLNALHGYDVAFQRSAGDDPRCHSKAQCRDHYSCDRCSILDMDCAGHLWTGVALRERDFVTATSALGAGRIFTLVRHFAQLFPTIIVWGTLVLQRT